MLILGIDPGIALTGYGVVESRGNRLRPLDFGCIETKSGTPTEERLRVIYERVSAVMERWRPEALAIEQLFFNRNVTTAFTVGQARGVILLAAITWGLQVREYTPMQVKQAVVGYGGAAKRQIQEMVRILLSLPEVPRPDDVADALGVAICHAHFVSFLHAVAGRTRT
jgi:crossover junction endodeoxyribonuclease RuvC